MLKWLEKRVDVDRCNNEETPTELSVEAKNVITNKGREWRERYIGRWLNCLGDHVDNQTLLQMNGVMSIVVTNKLDPLGGDVTRLADMVERRNTEWYQRKRRRQSQIWFYFQCYF